MKKTSQNFLKCKWVFKIWWSSKIFALSTEARGGAVRSTLKSGNRRFLENNPIFLFERIGFWTWLLWCNHMDNNVLQTQIITWEHLWHTFGILHSPKQSFWILSNTRKEKRQLIIIVLQYEINKQQILHISWNNIWAKYIEINDWFYQVFSAFRGFKYLDKTFIASTFVFKTVSSILENEREVCLGKHQL